MSPEFATQISRQTDVVVLRQLVLTLAEENERLQAEIEALRQRIAELEAELGKLDPQTQAAEAARLKEQIAQLKHRLHGRSSERRKPAEDRAPRERPAQPGHGPRPQPQLEVEETCSELAEEEQVCPHCGGKLVPLADEWEVSEIIDVIPRRYILRRHKRRKYRCVGHDAVVTAPGEDKLIPGGRYSPAFAVSVAVDKYEFHLPLERQVQMMKQAGLAVTPQTLWDQIEALARRLVPTYEEIFKRMLAQPVIGADETRWPLLANGKVQENKTCYAWCLLGQQEVGFRILDGRSQTEGQAVLATYKGIVMADAYAVYEALARGDPPPFVLANCWSHVRRKFTDVERQAPAAVKEVLDLIGALFLIERAAKPLTREARHQQRQTESKPLVEAVYVWAEQQQPLPQSGLAGAIGYLQNLKPGLLKFLDNPDIPLSNNACERAQRGLVLGRKNFYGSRSRRGNEVAAIFYSLIESAKLADVDPAAYLLELTRLTLQQPGAVLLPADFKQQTELAGAAAPP